MRFAILESKLALIRILQKYTLELDPKTPVIYAASNYCFDLSFEMSFNLTRGDFQTELLVDCRLSVVEGLVIV